METALQSAILLWAVKSPPSGGDLLSSLLLGMLLFTIYAGVQLPGYYKYGSIRGKIFMFIPTVGFLVFYYLAGKLGIGEAWQLLSRPAAAAGCVLTLSACIIGISAAFSIRIVNKTGR